VGIFAETVLRLADEYEAAVFGLVRAGKLGWSSGSLAHLVRITSDGEITRWPIGEASLTFSPAEPLNRAITVESMRTTVASIESRDLAAIRARNDALRERLAREQDAEIERIRQKYGIKKPRPAFVAPVAGTPEAALWAESVMLRWRHECRRLGV
jgi:hypothetical protein